jgi:hypothetical protein
MFNPEKKLKQGGAVEDIVHMLDTKNGDYIHPDEINTNILQDEFINETRDIVTEDGFRICSNEPGMGLHSKGDIEDLFSGGPSDNPDDIDKEVAKFLKENPQYNK